jgi:hypothetical protein
VRDVASFAGDFIALVRGDAYFRILIAAAPIPDDEALKRHARRAVAHLLKAYSV